jgi:hypothetical protein
MQKILPEAAAPSPRQRASAVTGKVWLSSNGAHHQSSEVHIQ